jgi:colanic acid/amylovoran/stewartan biosynthesis glycosyltransferase WcaL/AmsK/CpsK
MNSKTTDNKKLIVLHLFNSYLPQSENWAYSLIKNTPNVEIHIGANNYLKNNFYDPDFHFVDNYFDEFGKMNRQLGKRKLSDILKKLVIKSLPFIFGKYEQVLINYVKKQQIDLIHCHFADVGWQFLEVAQKTSLPLVISFYGWDYEKLPFSKPEYVQCFETLFQKAAAFICEGNHGAGILQKMGCPIEKIHVVHLGVETSKIPIFKRVKNKNELKLIQIASFTEKKGHIYTLKAFAKALKNCPKLELTLVGDARNPVLKTQVEDFIKTHNLGQKIKLLDFIGYSQLYNFLKGFQVFIHPSCYAKDKDCEGGAPIILLDVQATGMPVTATTHCDIPNEVIHKKSGLLSPEKDVNALAENIKIFYEMDNENYQRFAQNARSHVKKHYDISNNAIKLREVYQKIKAD